MIDIIYIIGKPGSGKSIFIWYLNSLLDEDGIGVKHISDRLGLEQKVLHDVKNVRVNSLGIKVGKHSKLIKDGPPGHRKVHVLDGLFLNQFHEQTIKKLSRQKEQKKVTIVEYATGPIIDFAPGKPKLLQDSHHFVGFLRKHRLINRVFIVDIDVPLSVREQREARRPDAMDTETFRSYFPDGGEISKNDVRLLNSHYYRFHNHEEDQDGYYNEARYIYLSKIKPHLKNNKRKF